MGPSGEEHQRQDCSPPRLPPLSLTRQRSSAAIAAAAASSFATPSPGSRQLSPSPGRRAHLEHAQSLDSLSFARLNSTTTTSPAAASQASFYSSSGSSSALARSPSIPRSRITKPYGGGAEAAAAAAGASPSTTTPASAQPLSSLLLGAVPPSSDSSTAASSSSQALLLASQGASRKKLLRSHSSFVLRGGAAADGAAAEPRKRRALQRKAAMRLMLLISCLIVVFFVCDWLALGYLHQGAQVAQQKYVYTTTRLDDDGVLLGGDGGGGTKPQPHMGLMYERLLALAAHALAESEYQEEPPDLWTEAPAAGGGSGSSSKWVPCADQRSEQHSSSSSSTTTTTTGYIMVSANGGLNQQRVAVCNAVAVARLLNATLVLPAFLYSSVWMDDSQFGDIYDADFFVDYLAPDVRIVRELPLDLRSLDLAAVGSVVTDLEIVKEAKPSFYVNNILPILLRNRVVHLLGFGNRLSFDPVPDALQRLRCRCNFHALRFVPRLQAAGDTLVRRIRRTGTDAASTVKYVGLHLRFEIDMVAHSMCEFGGGQRERAELAAYRALHFPLLLKREAELAAQHPDRPRPTAAELREQGWCPMTPEETVVMLAALGFTRRTRVFVAGAAVYGGASRLAALAATYPNLVTKEQLLTPAELAPFARHASQLAALDFMACAAADVFAMSDSGSQLASQVEGHRMYWGAGAAPTVRPNKKRLQGIFARSGAMEWDEFRDRVRKTVRESKRVEVRPTARSVYRHPRCPQCMCRQSDDSSAARGDKQTQKKQKQRRGPGGNTTVTDDDQGTARLDLDQE